MSIARCEKCDRLVDTDEDVECYDQEGQCFCESCRESGEQDSIADHIGVTRTTSAAMMQSLVRQLIADAQAKRGERPLKGDLTYQVWEAFRPSWVATLYWGKHKDMQRGEAPTMQEAIKRCLDQVENAPNLAEILGLVSAS